MKDFESYWAQIRERWQSRAVDPFKDDVPLERGGRYGCGFCCFESELFSLVGSPRDRHGCEFCPVLEVYGADCDAVEPLHDYYALRGSATVEHLSRLAAMVVQELDDKKDELIAAMRELWREANES